MRKLKSYLMRALIFCLLTFNLSFAQELDSKIDAIFERFNSKTPGCAVGIAQDGKVLFAKAYGMADLKKNVPLSTKSAFYMASVSKQFAAMSILLLAEDGRLQTSDSIRKTIPVLPEYANGITLYHLLTHTSGIRDYLTLGSLTGRSIQYTDNSTLQLITRQQALNFEPGAQFLYSNSGYVLLSLVVKNVAQRNLNEFAQERIFLPLGMKSTRFQHDHTAAVPEKVTGYLPRRGGWDVANSPLDVVGDGGLYSSVEDMLRWTANFDKPVISAKALTIMQTPGRLSNGSEISYGMGLAPGQYRGLRVVEHGGALGGYRTEFLRFPEQRFSVVCLCNDGSMNPSQFARRVANLYLSSEMKTEQTQRAMPQTLTGIALAPEELQARAGLYWNDERGDSEIVVRDGKLFARAGLGDLIALDKQRFAASGLPQGWELIFDGGNPIRGFVVKPPDQPPVRFERVVPVTLSAAEMQAYAGKFHSTELDTTSRIAVESNSLTLKLGDASPVRLRTVGRDLMQLDGGREIVFQRDGAGKIIGFHLNAGRVRKLQFRRM